MNRLLMFPAALTLAACAPQALYFHESTKVAFAADYNVSDSQPVAGSLGFKRRIVAVVPAADRVPAEDSSRRATNKGEALSIVSKFNVRVGTFSEGISITNSFASGEAARVMTGSPRSAAVLNTLLHTTPIEVSVDTGETPDGTPAGVAVDKRLRRISEKRTTAVADGRRRGVVTRNTEGTSSVHPADTESGRAAETDGSRRGSVRRNPDGTATRTEETATTGTTGTAEATPRPGGTSRGRVIRGEDGSAIRIPPNPTPEP
jgi:hypothetical protein